MEFDISVVIPTYKRKERLAACLDSFLRQDYPKEKFELVVVDDEASRHIEHMVRALGNRLSIKYLAQHHQGPACARSAGVKACSGKIIGFVDDDCVVPGNWTRSMVHCHARFPLAAAVGGLTVTPGVKTSVLVSQFLSTGAIETRLKGGREVIFFPTCNVSLKSSVFNAHAFSRQFPLPGGEDLEFFWRLYKDGSRFVWDKNITVLHYRDDTLRSFLRQAFSYGRGNFLAQHMHQDHPLLKELKTTGLRFWAATLTNIIKIPKFCYSMGRGLVQEQSMHSMRRQGAVYAYFFLHKIVYIAGNIAEFIRVQRISPRPLAHIPRLLILDITHACNLRCRICDIWKTAGKEKNIEGALVKKMISQAVDMGIPEIALSGGEPLLREDIFEIFEHARRIKARNVGVLTNGIAIARNFDRLVPYLLDTTIALVISLDSLTPGIHTAIRNAPAAHQETLEGLRKISLLKASCPQVNFNVITIVLDQNLEELADLAHFIKSQGANSLQFQPLLSNNLVMAQRRDSEFWVRQERLGLLDATIDGLIKFKQENPHFIKNSSRNLALMKKYYRGTLTSGDVSCASARETVLVSNQGTYATCFSCYGSAGATSLKDILTGNQITQAREGVKKCSWPCLLPCFCDN